MKIHSIVFLLVFLFPIVCLAKSVDSDAIFPDLNFKNALSKEERVYLEVSKKRTVSFKEIKGSLIIVELTNTYCTSCRKNISVLNDVYSMIENDPLLKGKIKVISIASGNNKKEVEMFIKEYKILYPVFTDYNFEAHEAMGSPRVPYTIFVKRDDKGKNIVVYTHQGIFESAKDISNRINEFL
jgi:thiol-disulfide isomerase/thioredoxin